jgi:hypothetical protein
MLRVSPVASSTSAITSACLCVGLSRETKRDIVLSRETLEPCMVPMVSKECMMQWERKEGPTGGRNTGSRVVTW